MAFTYLRSSIQKRSLENNILIITYYWPPASGPGVQRILKFCKYLPEFYWNPTIITVNNGSYPAIDYTLEKDIPQSVNVHRTKTLEPFAFYNLLRGKKGKSIEVGMGNLKENKSLLNKIAAYIRANYFIPDARIGWNKYAYKKASNLATKTNFHAILTSGPPHSTHLIGEKLKEKLGIPWIADFRDPWYDINYNSTLPRTDKSKQKDFALQKKVLQKSDIALVIGRDLANSLSTDARRIEIIRNGYDEEDFQPAKFDVQLKTEKFTLVYTGNFKENQNIQALWSSIKKCLFDIPGFSKDFNLVTFGPVNKVVESSIKDAGLKDIWRKHEFVPHEEAILQMIQASCLLLPIPQGPGNTNILTGKIFEYLASKTIILAIGPTEGEAARVLKDCNRNGMIDYTDQSAIFARLKKDYLDWKTDKVNKIHSGEEHLVFSRRAQTAYLANLLHELS